MFDWIHIIVEFKILNTCKVKNVPVLLTEITVLANGQSNLHAWIHNLRQIGGLVLDVAS